MPLRKHPRGNALPDNPPRVLLARLDKLVLRFRFSKPVHPKDAAFAGAAAHVLRGDGHAVAFLDHRPTENEQDASVLLWLDGQEMVASLGAYALSRYGHGLLWELVSAFACFLRNPWERGDAVTVQGTVSRADLCVDLQGGLPPLSQELANAVVGTMLRTRTPNQQRRGGEWADRGIAYGTRGRVQAVLYEKTEAAEGQPYLLAEWRQAEAHDAAGEPRPAYQEGERVWRVEFRLMTAEAFARRRYPRSPEVFLNSLPVVWRDLCESVLWFRKPTRTRQRDCPRVRWWTEMVEAIPWEGVGVGMPVDERLKAPTHLLAQIKGLLASVTALHTGECTDAIKREEGQNVVALVARAIARSAARLAQQPVAGGGLLQVAPRCPPTLPPPSPPTTPLSLGEGALGVAPKQGVPPSCPQKQAEEDERFPLVIPEETLAAVMASPLVRLVCEETGGRVVAVSYSQKQDAAGKAGAG